MQPHEFIRAQRVLGLTNEELAEALDIESSSIKRYRCGSRGIPETVAIRITDLLSTQGQQIFRNKMKYRRAA